MTEGPALGVYVHWPFCASLCPYCDFNSHVREVVPEAAWRRALLTELEHARGGTGARSVDSVFFGGGTPSLMTPETVAAVIDRIRSLWNPAADLEITLEANPGTLEAGRFQGFAAAGVNRISIGVQALDDGALAFLGRIHDSRQALVAIEAAQAAVPRVSIDLIYARPGQRPAEWRRELARALALGTAHVSLYQLTIEPGTAFHTEARLGRLLPAPGEVQEALWRVTREMTAAAGLPAYEISNHARPGEACRHNLDAWRGGDWVGVGPGAHGRLTTGAGRLAVARTRLPEAWLRAVERDGHGTSEQAVLDREQEITEMLLTGLRTREGIDGGRFRRVAGGAPAAVLDAVLLERLAGEGWLDLADGGIRATAGGWLRLDGILTALAPDPVATPKEAAIRSPR